MQLLLGPGGQYTDFPEENVAKNENFDFDDYDDHLRQRTSHTNAAKSGLFRGTAAR
jgi:hypothetical protein